MAPRRHVREPFDPLQRVIEGLQTEVVEQRRVVPVLNLLHKSRDPRVPGLALPRPVLEKIAHLNAERVLKLPAARGRGR